MTSAADWNFFSNHAHVLVCLAGNPQARLRDIAAWVGITERTALRLITELNEAGVINRTKEGRRNRYHIDTSVHLRHPVEAHCTVDDLLKAIIRDEDSQVFRDDSPVSHTGERS